MLGIGVLRQLRRTISMSTEIRPNAFSVVICGEGNFMSSYLYTKEAMKDHHHVRVVQSDDDDIIASADVIIPFMKRIDRSLLERAPNLKMVMQYGVGLEGVDIATASQRGIWVCLIPGADVGNAQSCAEQAIYLALSVLRDQKEMARSLATRRIGWPTGRTIMGANVLIYGFGSIGQQLARRLHAFDPKSISAVTRTLPSNQQQQQIVVSTSTGSTSSSSRNEESSAYTYLTELCPTSEYPRLAALADIVFICCTQNASTVGLVNREFISHLKVGAVIVNVARGGMFDYPDVYEALESGKLFGVGIDVFHTEPFPPEDYFLQHPRVVATPHVAGVTHISYQNMAKKVAENVLRIFRGEVPTGAVNADTLMNKSTTMS